MRNLLILNLSTRGPSGYPCFALSWLHGLVRILTFHLPSSLSGHRRIHCVRYTNYEQMFYTFPELYKSISKNVTLSGCNLSSVRESFKKCQLFDSKC